MKVAKSAVSERVPLTRFLFEEQRPKGQINASIRLSMEVVARSCKSISIAVGKGALGTTRYHREATTG